jgi:hypothetical protein
MSKSNRKQRTLSLFWVACKFEHFFANLRMPVLLADSTLNYETRDSNPHPNGTAPKTAAYTNSIISRLFQGNKGKAQEQKTKFLNVTFVKLNQQSTTGPKVPLLNLFVSLVALS